MRADKRKYYDENNNTLWNTVDYTSNMSMIKVVTKPPKPQSEEAPKAALLLAAVFVIFAVAQLFSFEKFIPLLETFGLPGGHGTAVLVACLIVITEVFALPFLLRMPLSPLMRKVSEVCTGLAVTLWAGLALWMNSVAGAPTSAGFLGASLELPVGWWTISFSLALFVLAGWALWGMSPEPRHKKKTK